LFGGSFHEGGVPWFTRLSFVLIFPIHKYGDSFHLFCKGFDEKLKVGTTNFHGEA
jgi:hypothetical protein